MGRPTKLEPGTADLIITLIEGGVPRDHAARAAGIHPATLYAWLARGGHEGAPVDPDHHTLPELRAIARDRNIPTRGKRTKADLADAINTARTPYGEFHDRVRAADSRFMASAIGKMRETGGDDWRMWDRLLERRFPELRIGHDPDQDAIEATERSGDEQAAQARLDRARDIKVKMLGTGTDG